MQGIYNIELLNYSCLLFHGLFIENQLARVEHRVTSSRIHDTVWRHWAVYLWQPHGKFPGTLPLSVYSLVVKYMFMNSKCQLSSTIINTLFHMIDEHDLLHT